MNEIELTQQEKQLLSAAREGNIKLIEELVKNGVNVNAKDADGNTSLHLAARYDHIGIVVALLQAREIDVNMKDKYEKTPAHVAIMYSDPKMLAALLKAEGIDVEAKNADKRTLLNLAVFYGKHDKVKQLLKAKANVNVADVNGNTPLHLAVLEDVHMLNTLLKAKANINAVNNKKETPLACVVQLGNITGDIIWYCERLIEETVLCDPEAIKPNYIDSNNELSKHWGKCKDEVRAMQKEKIGDSDESNLLLYQFLRKTDKNVLAGYLSNEETGVQEELKKGLGAERYPIYASMIESQCDKGIERQNSFDLCAEFLQRWNSDVTANLSQNWLYGPIKKLMSILPWCPNITINLPKDPPHTLPADQFDRLVKAVTSELTSVDVKNLTKAMMLNRA